jgi:hypothetical protein
MTLDTARTVILLVKRLSMHDPLCFEFDNEDDCGFDHSLASPFCYCEMIAKVREDERAILQFDLMADKYHAYQEAFEEGYKMGKEAGIKE